MRAASSLLLLLVLSGCFSVPIALDELAKDPPAQRHFMLQLPDAPEPRPAGAGDRLVRINLPYAAAPFDGRNLVYRLGADEWQRDYYNLHLASPAGRLGELTHEWLLAQEGITPLSVSEVQPAHLVLDLNLRELYGDFRDETAPAAVLRLEVRVLDADLQLRRQGTLQQRIPLASTAPEELVRGLGEALQKALAEARPLLR